MQHCLTDEQVEASALQIYRNLSACKQPSPVLSLGKFEECYLSCYLSPLQVNTGTEPALTNNSCKFHIGAFKIFTEQM